MRAAGIAYLAGLAFVSVDQGHASALLFLASAVTAAVVRHLVRRGRRCRHRRGTSGTGYFAGSP